MCDIDIKEWQDRLTDFEKIVLQHIYDQWKETGEWPKFLRLSVDVRDQGDLYNMAENLGYGFITAGNRGKSGEECKLTVLGVALCEGAEKDLDNFINFIKYCIEKYIEDPEDVKVSSEELKKCFSLSDVETNRLCELVYNSATVSKFCSSYGKTGDGKYSFEIGYNILEYEHIKNFEDYVSKLGKGYIPIRFGGTRGQKFADEEKSNSIKTPQSDRDINDIVDEIIRKRRDLNVIFNSRFKTNLFKDHEMAILDLGKPCSNEDDFNNRIQSLNTLIDEMYTKDLGKYVDINKNGSVNILEAFLKVKLPNYDKTIITNLRTIVILRSKKFPIHKDDPKFIEALSYFGFQNFPPDWEKLWKVVLKKYLESLEKIV
jgi:hypothetical protein